LCGGQVKSFCAPIGIRQCGSEAEFAFARWINSVESYAMQILAVDTATLTGSVAVLRDGRVVGVISTEVNETYSSRLFRQLEFLLSELKLEMGQFDVFAVATGPGSFTGLRVGLAAVKGWAEVFSKPIVAVSVLEAIAAQSRLTDKPIAAVLDARRGQFYAAIYQHSPAGLVLCGDAEVLTPEGLLTALTKRAGNHGMRFISPTPEVLVRALAAARPSDSRSSFIEPASSVLAPVIAELAYARAQRGEFTDALHLDANYVRRSDAELLWKEP
jgi:tRNA threonylcarbamoyladenosine biosynthesis protein TsaB